MKLTDKETAVVTLMLKGMRPGQIMRELGLSKDAYDSRRRRVMTKLKAKNDAQVGVRFERRRAVRSEAMH